MQPGNEAGAKFTPNNISCYELYSDGHSLKFIPPPPVYHRSKPRW